MEAAARHRGPRTVLVNAAEGEPLSAKDRVLCQLAPHLVLDGALAAARAIDARRVVVAVRGDAAGALDALQRASAERRLSRRLRIVPVPVAYLAGQESALINFLEGRALRPSTSPPFPVERGIARRPTLVQNPETLAHMALIDRGIHTGSALVTVCGAVRAPGVLEIADGETLAGVLDATGHRTEALRAVLVGGFHGAWALADAAPATRLDIANLRAAVIVALPDSACPVRETVAVMRYLAREIAGQCGPCANGMPAIAQLLEAMADGRAPAGARHHLARWSTDVTGRGACHLPDGAVRFLASALEAFGEDFADHARHGPCLACSRPSTLVPGWASRRWAA
jgi:NADH:ubiquinone oxidoreductase subunit F (NADH-binding)